jgi:DNA-binding CsgD family transcriptional regulator
MRELTCSAHPNAHVRRYRMNGRQGPGVYPQCIPADGSSPHILTWDDAFAERPHATRSRTTENGSGPPASSLSPSELAVLHAAATGLTVCESARALGKGSETVKTQRRQIILKLGARNITHAVGVAMQGKLIDPRRLALT